MLVGPAEVRGKPRKTTCSSPTFAEPYCPCWSKRAPVACDKLSDCTCGEDSDVNEWKWEQPQRDAPSWVVMSDDQKLVTFHPVYSSGTAIVRGDTPLAHNHHYYWEIKILTETYGTDIMVGLGTDSVNITDPMYKFTSLLGQDAESYGLSYNGGVRHNGTVAQDSVGFCRGSIVGVRVDMWKGTLEFYINRNPQGIAFYNLRRHQALYPMACSTAAVSSMRLIYAASWRASLLVDAARVLAASVTKDRPPTVPPGLRNVFRKQFWLTLPTEGCMFGDDKEDRDASVDLIPTVALTTGMKRRHWQIDGERDAS